VNSRPAIILGVMCLCLAAGQAEERIWLEAQINGKPVRLVFDTGADKLVLFPTAAKRLGLKVTGPPPGTAPELGGVIGGVTEDCTLSFHSTAVRVYFNVVDTPAYVRWEEEDGVLGWGMVSSNIFLIDAVARTVTPLAKVPSEATSWTRLPLQTNSILSLEIPHESGPATALLVDTGNPNGVALHPQSWRKWKAAHTNQAATVEAYFMPGAGLVVKEEMWANQLALGPVLLTDVPVIEANSAEVALGSNQFEASLGFAALKRLDLIVDGKHRVAYVRPKRTRPVPYEHNRLGAAFVPRDSQSDDLVASVAEGSPAWDAGIRTKDVLLSIDELDVIKWRSDPAILPFSRFWERPPGTKLKLTVKRDERTLTITVTLRQILSPEANAQAIRPPYLENHR
jgi:hypothetical protein